MKVACPVCFSEFAIEVMFNDEHARKVMLLTAQLPSDLGKEALQYIGMFRPKKSRLSWTRASKLLKDIHKLILTGQFESSGREWIATPHMIKLALETMLDRRKDMTLPLKNHNYFFQVLSDHVNRAEAIDERAEENTLVQKRKAQDLPRGTLQGKRPVKTISDLIQYTSAIAGDINETRKQFDAGELKDVRY